METHLPKSTPQPPASRRAEEPRLLDHVLVAVASDEDARQTCRVVLETVGSQLGSVTVVTVIPRYRQWSDSLPSDYRLENAYATLHVACGLLEDAGIDVEVSIEQSSNTSRAIHELAERIDASAIIFTPRSANRLMDFLAGDTTWSLVKKSSRPVLVLPLA